jgi:hypothetical protein
MMKTAKMLILAALMSAAAVEAGAQPGPAPANHGFLNINGGAQTGSHTINVNQTFPVYGENATLTTTQTIGSGALLDISAGYRFKPVFAVALGFSNFNNTSPSSGTAVIPDPLIFNQPKTVPLTIPDLTHSERTVYLAAVWFYDVNNKADIAFSIGPSFTRVSQEVASSVTVATGTQNATPVVTTENKTAPGVLIGVDGTYLFSRMFGAGLFLRYVGGKVDLPSVSGLRVGGFQIGAGARVRF